MEMEVLLSALVLEKGKIRNARMKGNVKIKRKHNKMSANA
jgi:hypothetical protein